MKDWIPAFAGMTLITKHHVILVETGIQTHVLSKS